MRGIKLPLLILALVLVCAAAQAQAPELGLVYKPGDTVRVAVTDASPFTLYGAVVVGEGVGVDAATLDVHQPGGLPHPTRPSKFPLPLA